MKDPANTVRLTAPMTGGWKKGDLLCGTHRTGYSPSCGTCRTIRPRR